MKYSELNLDPRLNSAIEKLGYAEATAIQEQTIPHILKAKDVAGLAQTGTGKTAAFLIPLIERIFPRQLNHREHKDKGDDVTGGHQELDSDSGQHDPNLNQERIKDHDGQRVDQGKASKQMRDNERPL